MGRILKYVMIAAIIFVVATAGSFLLGFILSLLESGSPYNPNMKDISSNLLHTCYPECAGKTSEIINFTGSAGDFISAESIAKGMIVANALDDFDFKTTLDAPPGVFCTDHTLKGKGIYYGQDVSAAGRIKVNCTNGACTLTCMGP